MSRSLYIFHVLFFFTATEAALTHQYSSQHPTLGIRPQLIDRTKQQVTDFDDKKKIILRFTYSRIDDLIPLKKTRHYKVPNNTS